MTAINVSLVDVYVVRGRDAGLECLVLRRGAGRSRPGSWETVHGHIEAGETPAQAAVRELAEETGAVPLRMYNLSRVDAFYQHKRDEIALIPVFAAFVAADVTVRLSPEHDRFEWLAVPDASARFAWPREAQALADAVMLVGSGDAGPVEDVLRVC